MSDFVFSALLALFFVISAIIVWLLGGTDEASYDDDETTTRTAPAEHPKKFDHAPAHKVATPAEIPRAVAMPDANLLAASTSVPPSRPRSIADELIDIALEPKTFSPASRTMPATSSETSPNAPLPDNGAIIRDHGTAPRPSPTLSGITAIKMLNPAQEQRLASFEKPNVSATLPPNRPQTFKPSTQAAMTPAMGTGAILAPSVAATLPPRTATDEGAQDDAAAEPEPEPAISSAPHPALALDAEMEALLESLDDPEAMANLRAGASPELSVIAATLSNKLVFDDDDEDDEITEQHAVNGDVDESTFQTVDDDTYSAADNEEAEPAFLLSTAKRGLRMIGAQAAGHNLLDLDATTMLRPQTSTIWSGSHLRSSLGQNADDMEILQMTPNVRAERKPVRAEAILIAKPDDYSKNIASTDTAPKSPLASVLLTLPPGARDND